MPFTSSGSRIRATYLTLSAEADEAIRELIFPNCKKPLVLILSSVALAGNRQFGLVTSSLQRLLVFPAY